MEQSVSCHPDKQTDRQTDRRTDRKSDDSELRSRLNTDAESCRRVPDGATLPGRVLMAGVSATAGVMNTGI